LVDEPPARDEAEEEPVSFVAECAGRRCRSCRRRWRRSWGRARPWRAHVAGGVDRCRMGWTGLTDGWSRNPLVLQLRASSFSPTQPSAGV